ncbi:uncharacterized protein LOC136032369 [Artemia franciscana]|uniref:Dolichyl-diphosphooligosaccharide--protein glycosyltransferase subunit 2 n=1 Tax=Artemia franciscana TaxID=6661 RepID=A0AA88LCM1_ARTSF|nr:hypothetical protein QYM36_000086 [Artemia franciscana]
MKNFDFVKTFSALLLCLRAVSSISATSYIHETDITRIKNLLISYIPCKDLSTLYGVSSALQKLDLSPEAYLEQSCNLLKYEALNNVKTEDIFYIAKSAAVLPKCGVVADNRIQEVLISSLNHASSMADLYYIVESLAAFNLSTPVEKIRPILDRILKQDDSAQSLGYAFHIASNFPGNIEQYYDRIEDVVVQADTVDNKYVQFEGGLSVTTLVLNGIFEISTKLGRKPDLNAEQVVGFGEYLVSRKTVRQAKSIANLLTSLEYLTTNQYFIPLVLSVSSQPVISSENRNLLVRVCDLLGNEIHWPVTAISETTLKLTVDLSAPIKGLSPTTSTDNSAV